MSGWMRPKSWALLAGVVALVGLNLLPQRGLDATGDLPELPAVPRESVETIVIATGQTQKVVLEGGLVEGWTVTQPYQATGDSLALRSLLAVYADGLTMDVRVDEGHLEDYGVDDQNGILVELYDGGDEPALAVVIGNDAGGGTSFVRLPGSDEVFRAKVGTRQRYDRAPEQWQDRMVTQLDDVQATQIEIQRLDLPPVTFNWDAGRGWTSPDADFPLDQKSVDALADLLLVLRAGEVRSADTDGGWVPPAAVVRVTLDTGEQVELTWGNRPAGAKGAYVRRPDRDAVYTVSKVNLQRVMRDVQLYRNKTLFEFPATEGMAMTLTDERGRVVMERHPVEEIFYVVEPANVDTEAMLAFFSLNTQARLRAAGVADIDWADAGLDAPTTTLTILLSDGSTRTLLIGGTMRDEMGRTFHYGGRPDLPGLVYLIDPDDVRTMRQGYGRAG